MYKMIPSVSPRTPCTMVICEDNCNISQSSLSSHWSDSAFVLIATCTATVAGALNLGLFASAIFGGVATKHMVILQLCACAIIACAALVCHVQNIWSMEVYGDNLSSVISCKSLSLATLFSHCAFLMLTLLELRISSRRMVIFLFSVISWCTTAVVSLAAGASCTPSSSILVFCFYVLHVPLAVLLIVNRRSSRAVAPTEAPPLPEVRQALPQMLLFFLISLPQAFLTAIEALDLGLFHSADAWCCLMTSFFAIFRPFLDTAVRPNLGDVAIQFICSFCRRKDTLL